MPVFRRPLGAKPVPDLLADVVAEVEAEGRSVTCWQVFGPDLIVVASTVTVLTTTGEVKPSAARQTRRTAPGEKR